MMTSVWAIALAGGAGTRLANVTGGVPKQFWHPNGRGSLIEETLGRLYPIVTSDRVVTVVGDSHREFVGRLRRAALGHVIYQSCNRGTAVGVLIPLVHILARAPDATVIITPTDHGVAAASTYRRGLVRAVEHVRSGASDLVLFGAAPTQASSDLGWVVPAPSQAGLVETFQPVADFIEKPPADQARDLFRSGAVWNTMLMVANGATLLERFHRHLSVLTDLVGRPAGGRDGARLFTPEFCRGLPAADFSRDLLALTRPLTLYTWPSGLGWADLGTPARLQTWLRHYAPPLSEVAVAPSTASAWA